MNDLEIQELKNNMDQSQIPGYMQDGIVRYVANHVEPGGFLTAVLENDLKSAVAQADSTNLKLLPNYVRFFYNYVPSTCWGSPERVEDWLRERFNG